jgi:mannose-1-phosphate guanylyltransferase
VSAPTSRPSVSRPPFHCLVLAAGLGTRLDPLTRLVAKPAVPLGNRSLIEHVLAWLRAHGVRDVVVNLHHRPASITAIVGDGTHLGLRIRYSWERQILGSAGGPRHALPLMDTDPVVIVNGDTLCDFPLGTLTAAHQRGGGDVTMAVVPNPAPDHYNGITIGPNHEITGFVPRGHRARGSWHFVGVQIAAAQVFEPLADGVPAETVAQHYREIVAAQPGRIRACPVETTFWDVGTPADYLRAALSMPPAALRPGGSAHEGSAIWPGAVVDAGAALDGCVVAGEVRLGADFRARRAVIIPATLARADDAVEIRDGVALFPL